MMVSPTSPEAMDIAVVMPAYNAEGTLGVCLDGLIAAGFAPENVTVVDDGSTDRTSQIASSFGVNLLRNETSQRPAAARNKGAAHAIGAIILFVDADVCVAPNIRSRLEAHLADPSVTGVIGSYDNAPRSHRLVGRYRNLLHAHTHQISGGEVPTFWTGLGAIRRNAFEAAGGFLSAWESIEDVELGLKVAASGGRIFLDPDIQGKHLKDWSIASMLKTDIWGRAVPWTRLLKSGRMPLGVLSTSKDKRISALALVLAMAFFLVGLVWTPSFLLMVLACSVFVAANVSLLKYLAASEGPLFAVSVLPLHALHHLAGLLGYAKVTFLERNRRFDDQS